MITGHNASVGNIFRLYADDYISRRVLPVHWLKAIEAIKLCRTAALGGHKEKCNHCGHVKVHYNSCGNRHCPQCQGANRVKWILEKQYDLLPVNYFHAVFTIPAQLHTLFRYNRKKMYNLIFSCVWETLQTFASNPENRINAKIGMIAIIHTWTQKLGFHPHLHCIVPAGGLTNDGKWKNAPNNNGFLFHFKALANTFRGKFLWYLIDMYEKGSLKLPDELYSTVNFRYFTKMLKMIQWNVNVEDPFENPDHVMHYLAGYTHRVAIANSRIISVDTENNTVTFSYKDRKNKCTCHKTVTSEKFITLFIQHFLPKRFVKIRNYGILSTRTKYQYPV